MRTDDTDQNKSEKRERGTGETGQVETSKNAFKELSPVASDRCKSVKICGGLRIR